MNKKVDSVKFQISIRQVLYMSIMGQEGFWVEQQRVAKIEDKKPVLNAWLI